jgi:amino acid transporter
MMMFSSCYKGVAYALLIVLAAVNSLNVPLAAGLQRWTTYSKLFAIGLVTIVGFVFLAKDGQSVHDNFRHSFHGSG